MTTTYFVATGAIQHDTIANSGTYAITADGAQGGTGGTGGIGGSGAAVSGDIYLAAGTVLEIVVGGKGDDSFSGGGGGGGSFVIETDNGTTSGLDIILAVAGGGGGGGYFNPGYAGGGQTAQTGGNGGGTGGGAGGVNGAAGSGGGSAAGGGGGYTGGGGGVRYVSAAGSGSVVATTFKGGAGNSGGGNGGFGGGGGGGSDNGGGGGGYGGGGGGGGGGSSITGGGGGGSYLDAGFTNTSRTGDATPAGERLVETLAMGDLVLTAEGAVAPVRWIGRRTLRADGENGYRFADPLIYLPIRIRAGALGDNLPTRDLLVSMDHAVLIDGLLVQAGALVNGTSIIRETRLPESFTYYHIELADHALVLAEGVPAETFVDNVNRMGFDNWAEHEALYGNEPCIAEMPYPRAQSHRQVPLEIRTQIDDRARALAAAARGLLAA
jgi:hypothetical protein